MGNTRILAQDFEYHTPETIQEALRLLNRYGSAARLIAGGTDVIPQLKYEKISPRYLINVMKIAGLSTIQEDGDDGTLKIGATAKLRDVKQYCEGLGDYACLRDALCSIGKIQVMNMGTLSGNLCTASPAADSAPPLLVLNACFKLVREGGERIVPVGDFFRGPAMTAMDPGEIMSEIHIPAANNNTGSAFIKIARVAADIAKINCAVAVERDGDICVSCRIALGAVAEVPMRTGSAERLVSGKKIDDDLMDEAARAVASEIKPLSDVRSTEFYRRHVSQILFRDTFARAWNRAVRE